MYVHDSNIQTQDTEIGYSKWVYLEKEQGAATFQQKLIRMLLF